TVNQNPWYYWIYITVHFAWGDSKGAIFLLLSHPLLLSSIFVEKQWRLLTNYVHFLTLSLGFDLLHGHSVLST
ncbi:hypothetical protein ACFOU2_03750, partial [Bacillus songklensis]